MRAAWRQFLRVWREWRIRDDRDLMTQIEETWRIPRRQNRSRQ